MNMLATTNRRNDQMTRNNNSTYHATQRSLQTSPAPRHGRTLVGNKKRVPAKYPCEPAMGFDLE